MLIERLLKESIKAELTHTNKVVVLYGARQVGKTTLIRDVLRDFPGKLLEINGDNTPFTDILSSRDLSRLKGMVEGYDLLFVDEAQRIPDIGINFKIMHDQLPGLKILATGSSSLDLANRVKEPLTGRTWTFLLFPVSVEEWARHTGANTFEIGQKLDEWLLFGFYPEVLTTENHLRKARYLREMSQSYLYKDLLALANVRYPEKLRQLLKLLAWQIGSLVSIHELSNTLQISRDTVNHYLDLLEKSFVIFRLSGFSRNLRKEMLKMDKIYFYDLGIRNALIENFSPLDSRTDTGQLWENFLMVERLKTTHYHFWSANRYFWRTQSGAELDLVEEAGGKLYGFEFKWGEGTPKAPKAWTDNYPLADFQVVNRRNFMDFIRLKD